jgi:membrane associated rhomboid family serine protease
MISITLAIIVVTCIISFVAFSNHQIIESLIFDPIAITYKKQWYRFITCGFIHADIQHLGFNMLSFYFFGKIVEPYFNIIFGNNGKAMYILMYVAALVVCLLPTYTKHRTNDHYRSLGASGAVSAIVFAGIFLQPLNKIYLFLIPVGIPGFVFAPIYLGISAYLSKKGGSNINHSAHIWGSIFGIAFLIVACALFSSYRPLASFIEEVQGFFGR